MARNSGYLAVNFFNRFFNQNVVLFKFIDLIQSSNINISYFNPLALFVNFIFDVMPLNIYRFMASKHGIATHKSIILFAKTVRYITKIQYEK